MVVGGGTTCAAGNFSYSGQPSSQTCVIGVVVAELVQLAGAQIAWLQLGVGAQDRDRVGGGHCHQLVQLRLAHFAQLHLDVQAHLGGMGV
jgi:hypothetical protein